MKKVMLLMLLITMAAVCVTAGYSETITIDLETATYSEIAEAINVLVERRIELLSEMYRSEQRIAPVDGISLRNIPWHSNLSIVEQAIGIGSNSSYHVLGTDGRFELDTPGFTRVYRDIIVAGYDAELWVCYVYPVRDGTVLRDDSIAEFYYAHYRIKNIADVNGLISDLSEKLSHLYGYDITYEGTDYRTWKDSNGNCVRLRALEDGCEIIYFASDINELISAGASAAQNEAAQQEELNRIQNQSNYDGL